MPEKLSVCDFVCLASDDLQNPNTSGFQSRLGDCRSTVGALEEVREREKRGERTREKDEKEKGRERKEYWGECVVCEVNGVFWVRRLPEQRGLSEGSYFLEGNFVVS